MADDEREEQEVSQKNREDAQQAAALDKVTDVHEEKVLRQADTSKVKIAMTKLAEQQYEAREAQRQKDKQLAAVKINESDVTIIAREFELHKKIAERALRENQGDLKATMKALISVSS